MRVNRRIKSLVGSATLAITAKAKELKSKGVDVVNFAAGEPDFNTPDFINKAAIDAIHSGFTKYTLSTGIPSLRGAISKKFLKDNNLTYTPSQIVVSCGAKHSIFNLIQVLVDEEDEVIIPLPYWVSYPEMVKFAGGTPRLVETTLENNFKISAKELEKNITEKTRLLILSSPSNPTGMLYSKEELAAIAEICVKKNIFVISDEIYEKLVYTDLPYTSIASLNQKIYNLTATVNGVSKSYAMTGWRIGYFGASEKITDYVKKLQDHSTSNPTSISQKAALAALEAPEKTVVAMCGEFKKRRDLMASLLDDIPQIKYVKPDGAFYIFCDISTLGKDSMSVCKQILEDAKVAVIPGEGFGVPGFARLSFATSCERIEEGLKRIKSWIEKHP